MRCLPISGERIRTSAQRAANQAMLHPKSSTTGLVALGAIIALAVFITHGSPLSGMADRGLVAGVTATTIGLVTGTILGWKKGTKQNEEAAKLAELANK